eukprot:s1968_g22.t2
MVQASATSATSSIYTSCGCDFDVFCKLFPIYFPGIFAKAIYATIAARQREALKNLANSKAKVAFCPILKGAIIESWAASQMIAMDAESWKSWKSLQEILEKCEEQLAIAEQWVAPEDLMSKLSSTQKQAVGNAMSASPGSWVEQCSRRHVSCIAATHPCAVGDSRAMSHLDAHMSPCPETTPASRCWSWAWRKAAPEPSELNKDQQLANRMMQKISKCRMEAVALDGLEMLMEPLAKANPNAKVVMLNWRTFPQWRKSLDVFTPKLVVMVFHNVISGLLPWLALLQPLDRWISGNVVENVLRSGGPPITEVSGPLVWLSFYTKVDDYFPKEQVFQWDPRKNTLEELCAFLEISPCPKKGKESWHSIGAFIAKLFSAGRSRGCIRRRVGCVKGFPGRTPWRYLRFSATLLVQGIRLLVFALLVAPACLYIGLQYFRSPQIDRAVRYGQKPRQFLDIYYPTKEATSSTGNPPVVITVMGDPGSCAKRQDLKMAMLWASCCNHPTTNDSDVVNVQEGEPLLGATWLTQKATIDAKETERTAAEAVEETLQVQDTGAETSPKRAVSEVDPIKKIINSVAPMVRNRIDTRTRKNPMPSRRFTAGVGAAAPASPPTSPTDPADAAAGASAASAAARASAASAASTARASAASAARSSSASAVNGDRGSQRNSQMSQRSTKRTRNSAMSNHSSASAMFLQGIGIDVRRRGRASVLSHHHGRVREDYELLESLGVGGFGEVFRGQRKQDGHLCAIKSVDLEKTDPEVFQIELDQARQLKHPNVVRLLSAYRDETAFWLVMELYPGGDLMGEILDYNFRRSEDNGFWTVGIPDDRLARYAYQIFSGLAYLHYHKIVHRDWATESGWFLGIPH